MGFPGGSGGMSSAIYMHSSSGFAGVWRFLTLCLHRGAPAGMERGGTGSHATWASWLQGRMRAPRRRGTWCAASWPYRQSGTLPAGRAGSWARWQLGVLPAGHVGSWARLQSTLHFPEFGLPSRASNSGKWRVDEWGRRLKRDAGRLGTLCMPQSPTALPARPSLRMTSPKCLPAEMTWSAASSRCSLGNLLYLVSGLVPMATPTCGSPPGHLCTRSRKM